MLFRRVFKRVVDMWEGGLWRRIAISVEEPIASREN